MVHEKYPVWFIECFRQGQSIRQTPFMGVKPSDAPGYLITWLLNQDGLIAPADVTELAIGISAIANW